MEKEKNMSQVAVIHSAFEDQPNTVAFVEAGDRTGIEALEYAYRWTQNIMDSWSLKMENDGNDDVTVLAPRPDGMGLRSTSMGDFMVFEGKKYKVAMVGFEELV
jgi:hypothetical protein